MDKQQGVELGEAPGYEGYPIGSDGSVWSFWKTGGGRADEATQLKPRKPNRLGYLKVLIVKRPGNHKVTRPVHQLVLEAFSGPRPVGMVARHLDGNKLNNHADNLVWGTPKENSADAVRHGHLTVGTAHHANKLTEDDVRLIRELRRQGVSGLELAARFGVTNSLIYAIALRQKWKSIL